MDKSLEQKFIKNNIFNPNAKGFVFVETINNPQ